MRFAGCSIILIIALVLQASPIQCEKVALTLYYEALCPDSVNFVRNELYPTWITLRDYFTVDFVPYGKATHRKEPDGSYRFQCQHGPNECLGNMIQACALHTLNCPDDQMRWVHCVMSSPSPHTAGNACCTNLGLAWEPINQCSRSIRGKQLLARYGDQTHALQPRLTFVPTVTFNGTYDRDLQNRSLRDLKGVICGLIVGTKPSTCG